MANNPEAVAGRFLHPYIRFFNAAPGARRVAFSLDGDGVEELPYGAFSRYIQAEPGLRTITLHGTDGIQRTQTVLPVAEGQVYTVALIGAWPEVTLLPLDEPTARNSLNVSNLRIANLSPDVPDVDVYANGFPILQDVEYSDISRYIYLKPNQYTYRINPENSGDVLLTVPGQTANVGQYYTLYLIGEANGEVPLSAVISVDAASYLGKYL